MRERSHVRNLARTTKGEDHRSVVLALPVPYAVRRVALAEGEPLSAWCHVAQLSDLIRMSLRISPRGDADVAWSESDTGADPDAATPTLLLLVCHAATDSVAVKKQCDLQVSGGPEVSPLPHQDSVTVD